MAKQRTRYGRRDLLKLGAGALAGSTLALPGLSLADKGDPVIDFVSESCGQAAGLPVLVGYASTCGSTGEVAAAIGKRLCEAGARVDVKHLPDVTDISGYRAFVIGSPIHAGTWTGEAVKFLLSRQAVLAKSRVAYFVTCMALSEDNEESRKAAHDYVRRPLALAPLIKPFALEAFAGKVEYAKMPKRFQPVMRRIVPEDHDGRNWELIGKWGDELAGKLLRR